MIDFAFQHSWDSLTGSTCHVLRWMMIFTSSHHDIQQSCFQNPIPPPPPKKKNIAFWPTNLDILARVCSLRPIWAKDPLKPREPRIGRRTSESVWPSWWRKANFHRSLDLFPCKPWSLGEPMQQIQYLHYHIWAQFFVGSYYYVIIFKTGWRLWPPTRVIILG